MIQPNIVFILLDDLGWRDLGCYGSSFYETPHLDKLSTEGALFTDAYASCPVCSPTRASLLSGKYPATVGLTNWIGGENEGQLCRVPYLRQLPLSEKSLATALREGGYRTWHVGKWHLGEREFWPENHGFDVNIGGCEWGMPLGGFFSPYQHPTLSDGPKGEYLTDRLTDEAIALLRAPGEGPFFLNLWHHAVHIPIQAPAHLVHKYELKAAALGLDQIDPFVEGEPFPVTSLRQYRVKRRVVQSDVTYAAMMENLDENIGRLLAVLDETGQRDNTIVIFTSDNGGLATSEGSPTCNAPLQEGKGWMYEGGTREPLLIRWPGVIEPGTTIDTPVTSPDFYPTLLQAAGLPLIPEQHCDGESLLPLLQGEPMERGPIFWHYPHYSNQGGTPGYSVRDGDWKLIQFFEDNHCELYNLREDIGEDTDLAAAHPERVEAMHLLLENWRIKVGGLLPERNPNWTA